MEFGPRKGRRSERGGPAGEDREAANHKAGVGGSHARRSARLALDRGFRWGPRRPPQRPPGHR
eukprot:9098866-Pyramimonas_sp.AAC.1